MIPNLHQTINCSKKRNKQICYFLFFSFSVKYSILDTLSKETDSFNIAYSYFLRENKNISTN